MELTELKDRIINSFDGSKSDLADVLAMIDKDEAVFPFNEYEHLICALLNKGDMTYDQYLEIRAEYISENPNLWIFEISAPRGFGEKFAQTYIQGKCSKLKKPSRKTDSNYSNQYDLWLDGIRIVEMRISQKSMTQLIASGNIRFKTAAKDFNRPRIGVSNPGCAGSCSVLFADKTGPGACSGITKAIRRMLSEREKLFAGRIQALMNSANQTINRPGKLSGL